MSLKQTMETKNVSLPSGLIDAVKVEASAQRRSFSNMVAIILEEHFERLDAEGMGREGMGRESAGR